MSDAAPTGVRDYTRRRTPLNLTTYLVLGGVNAIFEDNDQQTEDGRQRAVVTGFKKAGTNCKLAPAFLPNSSINFEFICIY